jgi:hypothetical protein
VAFSLRVHPSGPPRSRLRELDRLLDDLEDLNLNDMTHLPIRIGCDLQDLGITDPYRKSISDLIDRVFELQEPLLQTLRANRGLSRLSA